MIPIVGSDGSHVNAVGRTVPAHRTLYIPLIDLSRCDEGAPSPPLPPPPPPLHLCAICPHFGGHVSPSAPRGPLSVRGALQSLRERPRPLRVVPFWSATIL